MLTRRFATVVLLTLFLSSFGASRAAQPEAPEYGPAKGTLVIVGGGATEGTGIIEKFIELAGGPEKKFVIVPTAGGNRNARRCSSSPTTSSAGHRAVGQARPEERQDAAHARSEGGRHRGVRAGAAGRRRRLVQRRPPVEHRRFRTRTR